MLALRAPDDDGLVFQLRHVALAFEQRLDHAVGQQVGITADRRSEMGIGGIRQPEVAEIVRAVDRLLHGAQAHGLQQRVVGAPAHRIEELAVVLGGGLVAAAQRQAHGAQEITQGLQALGRGAFMDAVQAGVLAARHEIGSARVGRQHAFFDQLVGIVAHHGHDLFDTAQFVADDARLDRVEIDGAALAPLLRQQLVQLVQVAHMRHDGAQRRGSRAARLLQRLPDTGVRGARMRMHHRVVELVGRHRSGLGAGRRDHHVAHQHQAVDIGVERAQPVGQHLGQHRNHAARKIHAGAALVGIVIERVVGPHIVADVGDGHQQAPGRPLALAGAQFDRLAVHRVVEIARVLAVDGDQRHVAQIDALLQIGLAYRVRQPRGLLVRGLRKIDRHVELAHRDLDFHAGIVDLAQHLIHAAQRLRMAGGLLHDLHRHHLPMLGAVGVAGRNENVVLDALVLGHDDGQPMFVQETAHQFVGAPLDDLDDGAFRLAAVLARRLDQDAVAVQHFEHLARRQENIGPAVIPHQEAEAIAVALYAAGHEIQLGGQQQHTLAVG
ncbi:Uncharacterised protein [Bordetella pertussis]|nr:Uncharacterised protein [Bordetella pertussis]